MSPYRGVYEPLKKRAGIPRSTVSPHESQIVSGIFTVFTDHKVCLLRSVRLVHWNTTLPIGSSLAASSVHALSTQFFLSARV